MILCPSFPKTAINVKLINKPPYVVLEVYCKGVWGGTLLGGFIVRWVGRGEHC